jgi:hypothetical protein
MSELNTEKEPSVDISAFTSVKVEHANVDCTLDVLVECKYRHPGVTWLFLPDPNQSPFSFLASVLQRSDRFSPWFVHDLSWDRGGTLPVCYKGLEIGFGRSGAQRNGSDGESDGGEKAFDSQIRHGVKQLQFAVPSLVMSRIANSSYRSLDKLAPFFFACVLVTTADLVVTNKDFSRSEVEKAKSPYDLGQKVGALTFIPSRGPEFDEHARRTFSALTRHVTSESMQAVEQMRRNAGEFEFDLPSHLARRVANEGSTAVAISGLSAIMICNMRDLTTSVEFIVDHFRSSAASITAEPPFKW